MDSEKLLQSLNITSIKNYEPKEYITLMSHALRLGALYKAKFFMWLENCNYEILAQDDEALEHFIKEIKAVHKKSLDEAEESDIDFLDNVFYLVLKETGEFSEADCISLSLVLLAFISFKSEYISNEEYLEIRDLLVPYKVMISQCKIKPKDLLDKYKIIKESADSESDIKLLLKLGKGVVTKMPSDSVVFDAFKEITYDQKSWEKE